MRLDIDESVNGRRFAIRVESDRVRAGHLSLCLWAMELLAWMPIGVVCSGIWGDAGFGHFVNLAFATAFVLTTTGVVLAVVGIRQRTALISA